MPNDCLSNVSICQLGGLHNQKEFLSQVFCLYEHYRAPDLKLYGKTEVEIDEGECNK